MLVTVLVRGYYADVPQAGWILVVFLAALVGVKGLSMVWTISETETVKEVLRSSMYQAVFVAGSGGARLRAPGRAARRRRHSHGQPRSPATGCCRRSPRSGTPGRLGGRGEVDSTLGYANTLRRGSRDGGGAGARADGRDAQPLLRGIYAALTLAFLVVLYLTVSRGGIGSLGVGLVLLFLLVQNRLQALVNLLLVASPWAWLLWRVSGLGFCKASTSPTPSRLADGLAFGTI